MGLYVRQLKLGPMDNFVYLVGAEGAPQTAIVDAAWDVEAALRAAEEDGRTITHALVSHHHFDHVNGLPSLLESKGVPIHVHSADASELDREVQSELRLVAGGDAVEVGPLARPAGRSKAKRAGSSRGTPSS